MRCRAWVGNGSLYLELFDLELILLLLALEIQGGNTLSLQPVILFSLNLDHSLQILVILHQGLDSSFERLDLLGIFNVGYFLLNLNLFRAVLEFRIELLVLSFKPVA